jgi:hypothetical protein
LKLKRLVFWAIAALCAVASAPALAAGSTGVKHLHFHAGPYTITPGANLILLDSKNVPKPNQDGYMVRIKPNLRYALANRDAHRHGGPSAPGGLYDELDLVRTGVAPSGGAVPGPVAHSVRLFRSLAHYFDKRGPISWDLAVTATAPDWRPVVRSGDQLRISATYETKRASWYESMAIMVVWEAWNDQAGTDAFTHALDQTGHVTHGQRSPWWFEISRCQPEEVPDVHQA